MARAFKIKSENDLSRVMQRILDSVGHCQPHEDKYNAGVPDLSFAINGKTGWLELKYEKKVDKLAKVKIKHFKKAQRDWLKARGRAGRNCWLLVYVDPLFCMIPWTNFEEMDKLPWGNLWVASVCSWSKTTSPEQIIDLIKGVMT